MNNIKLHNDCRKEIKKGIDILAESVKWTLGPNGRNAIIVDKFNRPYTTKDGVSIAKSINFSDPFLNAGAQLIKSVAVNTCDKVGDGTTSSIIIAQEMLNRCFEEIDKGVNPVKLKRGIEKACRIAVNYIKQHSTKIDNKDMLKNVAYVSTNNDKELSELVVDALDKVGKDGAIRVEESAQTYVKIQKGMQIENGYMSNLFINSRNSEVEYENARIFITNHDITTMNEIKGILEDAIENNIPLVIVANKIDEDVVRMLAINKANGVLNVVTITAPGVMNEKQELLRDLAILTGGTFYDKLTYDKIPDSCSGFGQCGKFVATANTASFINSCGKKESIDSRIKQLKYQLANIESPNVILKIKERIAKLSNGIATIYVGGLSELEMKEKKDRVDDALAACNAALSEGIVVGGGISYLNIAEWLKEAEIDLSDNEEIIGYNICIQSLIMPFKQILINGGESFDEIYKDLMIKRDHYNNFDLGFNGKTNVIADLFEDGIVDPAKVIRNVIENAANIVTLVILTESIVTPVKEG